MQVDRSLHHERTVVRLQQCLQFSSTPKFRMVYVICARVIAFQFHAWDWLLPISMREMVRIDANTWDSLTMHELGTLGVPQDKKVSFLFSINYLYCSPAKGVSLETSLDLLLRYSIVCVIRDPCFQCHCTSNTTLFTAIFIWFAPSTKV